MHLHGLTFVPLFLEEENGRKFGSQQKKPMSFSYTMRASGLAGTAQIPEEGREYGLRLKKPFSRSELVCLLAMVYLMTILNETNTGLAPKLIFFFLPLGILARDTYCINVVFS